MAAHILESASAWPADATNTMPPRDPNDDDDDEDENGDDQPEDNQPEDDEPAVIREPDE